MADQFPIRKSYLLIAALILLGLISYQLAFKQTIVAWQMNRSLHRQLDNSANISVQPAYQERKNKNLDMLIGSYRADSVDFRSGILSEISELAQKQDARLSEVPTPDPLYHSDFYIIQRLNFSGNYPALVKVLQALEMTPAIGFVRSASFKVVNDISGKGKSKKIVLECYFEILNK